MKHSLLIFVTFVTLTQMVYGQSLKKVDKFGEFIALFNNIEIIDTELVQISPEFSGYGQLIDSSFFQFFDPIPYFLYWSTFKLDLKRGYLVGILYEYGNDFTNLFFIQLIVYDSIGCIKDKVYLPYIHIVNGHFWDRWYMLVSSRDIYCISSSIPIGSWLKCEGVHFRLDYENSEIVRQAERNFKIPLITGADKWDYGE